MFSKSIFDRNLLSLSLHNKELAISLSRSESDPLVLFKESRTGKTIPVIRHNNRDYALHSLFDPEKEGVRYSESVNGGYVVVFGFGAGYHIEALLRRIDVNSILVIERNLKMFKSILGKIDLSALLSDPRVSILIDKDSEYISDYLPANYLPAVSGDLNTMSLRSRVDSDRDYFNSIFSSIKNVLDTLSDDYTVQTWFGKRWFLNSVSNLSAAEKSVTVLSPKRDICIAAAGPSLEFQLPDLKSRIKNSFLITTDTALTSLIKHDILPDLIISIDCQQITYHHFMAGLPENIPVVLDLASPPFITRLTDNTLFFTSGHPFSRYINRNWRKFPFVDTSGGNVTHAAISLADSLGAENIYIYGADFSYPSGKSYARGTYIYPYFTSTSTRSTPLESCFYNFLYRNDNIIMKQTDYGYRYQTRPMLSYKERLEKFADIIDANIIPVEGLGEPINIPGRTVKRRTTPLFSAGKSRSSWRNFLINYKSGISNLSVPDSSPSRYLSGLDYEDKDIWTTLFPIAAVLRKKYRNSMISSSDILKEVRDWALEVIEMNLG